MSKHVILFQRCAVCATVLHF